MKTILLLAIIFTPTPAVTVTSMDQLNVSYPENIEHCERNFYLPQEERTFDDQCDTAMTLHYIINK